MCSPGTQAGYTKSSESVLENYFKCSAYRMSTFRVLYNLQVLILLLLSVSVIRCVYMYLCMF